MPDIAALAWPCGVDGGGQVKENPEEDGLVILDALAASGLRSIRYMKVRERRPGGRCCSC